MIGVGDEATFLADFGVACSAGGHTFTGLYSAPTEALGFEESDVLSPSRQLTVRAADVAAAGLVRGAVITVAGQVLRVHAVLPGGDGAFTRLDLTA